jgi:hypothetical protein
MSIVTQCFGVCKLAAFLSQPSAHCDLGFPLVRICVHCICIGTFCVVRCKGHSLKNEALAIESKPVTSRMNEILVPNIRLVVATRGSSFLRSYLLPCFIYTSYIQTVNFSLMHPDVTLHKLALLLYTREVPSSNPNLLGSLPLQVSWDGISLFPPRKRWGTSSLI